MKFGKLIQLMAAALLMLGASLASPAEARGFRIRHIPVPHAHRGTSPGSQPQQDEKQNPWSKDAPSPQPSSLGGGFAGGLMTALLFVAWMIWTAFKSMVRRAQDEPEPWSPSAPAVAANSRQSDFQQRLQQELAGLEQPVRGDPSRAPASAVLPLQTGGFGKRNF